MASLDTNASLALALSHDPSPVRKRRRVSPTTNTTNASCYDFVPVHDNAWETTWWDAPSDLRAASPPYEDALNAVSYADLLAHICQPPATHALHAHDGSPPPSIASSSGIIRAPSSPPCTPLSTTSVQSQFQFQSQTTTEALVAGVVAEWLQNHEPVSPLLQNLFRTKGYQLVPIVGQHHHPPGQRAPAAPVRRKKPSSMAAWWARFHRITASDMALTPSQLGLVASPSDMLAGFDLAMPASHASDMASNPIDSTFFTCSILFTISLSTSSFRMSILTMTMRLFFFVASQPSFWAAHAHDRLASFEANSRLERLNDNWYAQLYHTLAQHLPPAMTEDLFRVELDTWRKAGRKYAFIAHHLGLGSLIHLRDYISPSQLWGCTTGGERSSDANTALDFLQHTLAVPHLAETSGSNALMHAMLWMLFERLPMFGPRAESGLPFPGFKMASYSMVD